MITNFKEKSKTDDIRFFTTIIVVFLLLVWVCTPPGNKFVQVCFWGNNTQMFIAKMRHEDTKEYLFHRNNAVYLAKMYPKKSRMAIAEMNKSIQLLPSYASEAELKRLYNERAQIHMYYGDYKEALSDYEHSGNFSLNDYLRMALLYKEAGNYRMALSYCNSILNTDNTAFAGYACLADIYDSAGKSEYALRVWNLALDRRKNSPRSYLQRALIKKKLGDEEGYNADLAKAKEYSPHIDLNDSIIEDTLHPKILMLSSR